jgi:CO/xanthine dehydrogenase FAD-binding subunit
VKTFEYARPETLNGLFALMREHGSGARLLGGGTDLLVRLRKRGDAPDIIIDVKGVGELTIGITSTSEGIRIGALVVMTDLIEHDGIRRHFPALAEAAMVVGSIQIRNRATLSGNICNASPAADTAPALLAYAASVNVAAPAGSRRVPLEDFFAGPGRTVLRHDEIVESIDLPFPLARSGAAFGRLTRRRGVDLAIINLCCHVQETGEVRVACGAVGPRPFLVRSEGRSLRDDAPRGERAEALGRLLASASPISDLRARADYRTAMLPVLARRTLDAAIARMRQS